MLSIQKEGLAMQTDYVRQAAEKEIREGRVAGSSVLALQNGEELYQIGRVHV